ncbi:uncharacterized protein METZ01_LOCUS121792 [marine metagenome]|uniref:DNA (cytosine-5-)-methyltransferase n=1 Tax=marine metagenome TaxID=408172 RepID=A0A381XW31_9ZZZZ
MPLRDIPDEDWERMDALRGDTPREEFVRRSLKKVLFPERTRDDELPFGTEPVIDGNGTVPFTFVDLFAGIGGFRCGLTAVGGKCVKTYEWDKFAAKTYRRWYGVDEEEVVEGDFTEIDPAGIPDHDVLAAGFPCQPFSLAGVSKKQSLGRLHGFDDPDQGNLFFAICRAIEAKKPPVVFLENVKNLTSHDRGRTWAVIWTHLETLGYHVFSQVIDASGWVPQHRERIFIVAFRKATFGPDIDQIDFQFPDPPPPAERPRFGDILELEPDLDKYQLSDALWQYLQDYKEKHRKAGNGFGYGIADPDGVSRTMSARYHKDGSEILIRHDPGENPRRLTPREAALLQGFDDDYARMYDHPDGFPQVVSDTQAYRQFGNAVSPKVVEAIAREIVPILRDAVFRSGHRTLLSKRLYRREAA